MSPLTNSNQTGMRSFDTGSALTNEISPVIVVEGLLSVLGHGIRSS